MKNTANYIWLLQFQGPGIVTYILCISKQWGHFWVRCSETKDRFDVIKWFEGILMYFMIYLYSAKT